MVVQQNRKSPSTVLTANNSTGDRTSMCNKDNLAKRNEELTDNDELQEKLDGLANQFHIKYDDFKQKINETEEGIKTCRLNLKQQAMK